MARIVKYISVVLGACILSAPLAVVVTIVLFPLWSWIEDTFGIESVGHSGPAGWCYILVYALFVIPLAAFLVQRVRRFSAAK